MKPAFTRTEAWLQAARYTAAVMSDLPRRNGWTIAKLLGDRTPDRTQRLLNRASWDEAAAMSAVRRFAVAGLDHAARRSGRSRGLTVGALDETGQEKHGTATAGVQRQHMGCAGGVENGINTVHLSYVREGTGHALIGARQWIPAGQIADPVRSLMMALPLDLQFATKGQLAAAIVCDALADGVRLDFVCGDDVYGSCTPLRDYLEEQGQAYVLRVPSSFRVTLAPGVTLTCAQAVRQLTHDDPRWEIRSAGKGSKGERWYAWACIAASSPRDCLLIRRHLRTGERLYHAILRHTILVMGALAVCAVTAALLKNQTGSPAPLPARPDQLPPANPGMIALTVPEVRRLIAATARLSPPGHAEHWSGWMRSHQARARWFHHRTRITRDLNMNALAS